MKKSKKYYKPTLTRRGDTLWVTTGNFGMPLKEFKKIVNNNK